MRKITIIAAILIILVGLLGFALFNLNRIINKNKGYLLSKVEDSLGRDVSVREFEVNLLRAGVRLKDFSVSDDQAFSEETFIRAPYLQIDVEFLPLLWKELKIEKLILHQPIIRIIRNENGQLNFESLGASEDKEKKEEDNKKEEEKGDAELPVYAYLVNIESGEVHYIDRKEDAEFRVRKLDFTLKDISYDKPISVNLDAAIFAEGQNFSISGQAGPLGSPPDFSNAPLEGEIKVAQLNMGNLKKSLPLIREHLPENLDVDGLLSLNANVGGTPENLVITEGVLDATDGEISFGEIFHKPEGVPFLVSTDAQITGNAIDLEDTEIKLQTLVVNADGKIGLGETPSLDLTVNSNQIELSVLENMLTALRENKYDFSGKFKVNARIQGELGEGKAPQINGTLTLADAGAELPQIAKPIRDLSTQINFTGEGAKIRETSFFIGESRINLVSEIQKFSPLTLTYSLSSPELRLADLIETDPANEGPGVLREVKSEGQIRKEGESLSYEGSVSSPRGTAYDVDYRNLKTTTSLANRVLSIESLQLRALDGSLQGSGKYELQESPPQFTLSSQIRGLNLRKLFESVLDTPPTQIRGRARLDLDLSGRGDGWEEIKPTLTGQGQGEVVNGTLVNFNIAEKVLSSTTGIPGISRLISPRIRNKYPEIFATRDTKFDEFEVPFTVNDKKIQTDNLLISASDYEIRGEGWLGFDKLIDFSSVLILSEGLSQDIAQDTEVVKYIANQEGRLEIPFAISGTLPDVKPRPDLSYLTQLVQRATIRRGTEGLKEKFLDDILSPSEKTSEKKTKSPAIRKGGEKDLEKQFRKGLKRFLE